MTEPRPNPTPALRVTAALAAFFGGFGMAMPFLAPWLEQARGLSGVEIGAILSSAQLARILVGPMLAAWADGFEDRRAPIRVFAILALIGFAAFFQMEGFWGLFIVYFTAASVSAAIVPLLETMALRIGGRGPIPYGVIRGVGSISFIGANVIGGAAVAAVGLGVAPWWILCGYAAGAFATLGLRPDPAPKHQAGLSLGERLALGFGLLRGRRFLFVVAGASLIQASHGFYYAFGSVVWAGMGAPATVIGLLWAIGVAAEVAFLLLLVRIEKRLPPETLLLLGAAAGVLRWATLAFMPPVWALWPIQCLHALTFAAAHVGALRIIQREAPESVSGLAQTMYSALSGGLFMGLSTLGSGVLYDLFGARGYGVMAGLALGGGALIWLAAGEARIGLGARPPPRE